MCNDNWEDSTVFRRSSKNIVYYAHPDNRCTLHNSRYFPAAQFAITGDRDKYAPTNRFEERVFDNVE